MLFDLRSRGRRRTVQVVYVGLAVLIGAGLVLFGVGTGSGGGGLFGAFTGSNSSGGGNGVTSQVKKAVAQTKKNPSSASAWQKLVAARFAAANSVGYDTATSTYTKTGQQQLQLLTQAYSRYSALVKTPSAAAAFPAAKAYAQTSNWSRASAAYQVVFSADSSNVHALECVALTSYAAKDDRVAALAQARVLAKLPKSVRTATKSELEQAKTSTTIVTRSC